MKASLALPQFPSGYGRISTPRPSFALPQDDVENLSTKRRISINVRGLLFETFQTTLEQFPDTMLGCPTRRVEFYDPVARQYYLDRDPAIFDSILFYYQSNGIISRPECISQSIFNEELEFFGIKEMKDSNGKEKRGKCETTSSDDNEVQTGSVLEITGGNNCQYRVIKLRNYCWSVMEYPKRSLAGKIWVKISITVILLSVFAFCLETMPELRCSHGSIVKSGTRIHEFNTTGGSINESTEGSQGNCTNCGHKVQRCHAAQIWLVIETSLVMFFLLEYLIRIFAAPNRCNFVLSLFGLVDAAAIAPYFITVAVYGWKSEMYHQVTSFSVLRIIRLFRVIRVFKLSRYSDGLKLVGKAFKGTWRTFFSLMLCVVMIVVVFSGFLFYTEGTDTVSSIFESFYWAFVTMTTVGYGDVVPRTIIGKLTASACMVFGIVLLLILPLPVFVTHFNSLYEEHVSEGKRRQGRLGAPSIVEKFIRKP